MHRYLTSSGHVSILHPLLLEWLSDLVVYTRSTDPVEIYLYHIACGLADSSAALLGGSQFLRRVAPSHQASGGRLLENPRFFCISSTWLPSKKHGLESSHGSGTCAEKDRMKPESVGCFHSMFHHVIRRHWWFAGCLSCSLNEEGLLVLFLMILCQVILLIYSCLLVGVLKIVLFLEGPCVCVSVFVCDLCRLWACFH